MQEMLINLVKNKKGDPDRLITTVKAISGVNEVSLNLDAGQIKINVSNNLEAQHIINEINIKTGFRAF